MFLAGLGERVPRMAVGKDVWHPWHGCRWNLWMIWLFLAVLHQWSIFPIKVPTFVRETSPFTHVETAMDNGKVSKEFLLMYVLYPDRITGQSRDKPVASNLWSSLSCPKAWHVPGPQAFGTLGRNISFSLRLIEQAIKCTALQVPWGTLSISCTWR